MDTLHKGDDNDDDDNDDDNNNNKTFHSQKVCILLTVIEMLET